ncbi:hypothetical protein OIY81_1972 [Cryptosporidium canis]|uniref:SRR1-like domain-containing protein n=1 Tax=Cryptosporidium canis TaxID=195482 RepID=A0ABQ8P9P4_9CRYT|nr:hypothetical protein OIY81_1972 [Cryptosporidium canis]KAJ1613565.1 hypothetical protein OJ252_936 [Cryptosporidium canis]
MDPSADKCMDIRTNVRSLKEKVLECKGRLLGSEFWNVVTEKLETEILENWYTKRKCLRPMCISRSKCVCFRNILFVVGLGSLESSFNSNVSSFFQLAAIIAINERIKLEGIYFCDPEFTHIDRELIFEMFMTYNTHIEVFTGHDLSIPLNMVHYQLKNKLYGRDCRINVLLFMPHCDRCVFGMLIHYFKFGDGRRLYSDSTKVIVWGNNLDTFKVDSNRHSNNKCEYCRTLSLAISSIDFSSVGFPVESYKTVFFSSFSDLSIYLLPIG